MVLHFLNVFFVLRSPQLLLCFPPQLSVFSHIMIFPSFWVKSLQSQTLVIGGSMWNKKCECQRNANAFEQSSHSFGFPQIVHMHDWNVHISPTSWHKSFAMCWGAGPCTTHGKHNVSYMWDQLQHIDIDLCQPIYRYKGVPQEVVHAHDLRNPKLCLQSLCSNEFGGQVQLQLTFVPHINP